MIGQTIGHYRILERLGSGSMGVVYRAWDERLERDVAIKMLPDELLGSEEGRRRLRHEARSLSRLNHPGIETVHELGTHGPAEFLVAEYVPGITLAARIHGAPMPVPELLAIGIQIAEALEAAHASGVIHRDLKPANVMITGGGRVKVLDFGLARMLPAEGRPRPSSSLEGGAIAGTFAYLAPEVLQGRKSIPASDLYSLGAMLYEMATGMPPFGAGIIATLVFRVLNEPATPPSAQMPGIPPGLDAVIMRCLAKDPAARHGSAAEVVADLKRVRDAVAPAAADAAAASRRGARHAGGSRASRGIPAASWPVLALAGVVIALALLVPGAERFLRSRPRFQANRVVVAMYVNDTGDRSLDPVGRMAADWISQGLARTGLVEVVPSGIVLQISGGAANAGAPGPPTRHDRLLGEETAAATVVTGAYYRLGDSLVFQTHLTDAASGRIVTALDPVGCDVTAPLVAIEELRRRVTASLATRLNPALSQWADQVSRPPSFECYREYIEGLESFVRRRWEESLVHFDRAVAMDSSYYYARINAGLAHLNLSRTAAVDSVVRSLRPHAGRLSPLERRALDWLDAWLGGDPEESFRVSRDIAALAPASLWGYQHALSAMLVNRPREAVAALEEIDPERGVYRGWTPYWETRTAARHMLGEYGRERKDARRAREQYPEQLSVLACLVRAEAALGRAAAVSALVRASASLPAEPGWNVGTMMLFAARELRAHGRADSAKAIATRAAAWLGARATAPRGMAADSGLFAAALYLCDRWPEARAVFERLAADEPGNASHHGYLGAIAAREGRLEEARSRFETLDRLSRTPSRGTAIYWQADIAALLGERARAIALLRAARDQGRAIYFSLHSDPDLESLRGDPEFRALLRPKG